MDSQSLRQQLPQLQAQKFAGMSDDDLLAYVRIFYSLYHMVSVNSLADEYGTPALYRRKITTLYRMLCRRYYKRGTIAEKAKIHAALYGLLYLTEYTVSDGTAQLYSDEAECLIAKFLRKQQTYDVDSCNSSESDGYSCHADMSPADDEQYYVMKLIVLQWYGVVDHGSRLSDLNYVENEMTSWADEQNADGSWNKITSKQALQRISLLNLYSDLMGDDRYRMVVYRAYPRYCDVSVTDSCEMLYDAVRDITCIGVDVQGRLDAIASSLPQSMSARAIQLENECRLVGRDIQNNLFGA